MKKYDVVQHLLQGKEYLPAHNLVEAYAPANIALCKYWGKRDTELNLPWNSSLSISLLNRGANTKISLSNKDHDEIIFNNNLVPNDFGFHKRIVEFLDLIRPNMHCFLKIDNTLNIPLATGLASSACSFAALSKGLNKFFNWGLSENSLSIIARLGSGSACRSLWNGFVEWQMGIREDGMDSFGYCLNQEWNNFRVGLLILSHEQKTISSRQAMQKTIETAKNYSSWVENSKEDFAIIKNCIINKHFLELGKTVEENSIAMHMLMSSCNPPINFTHEATIKAIDKIRLLRKAGLEVFYTQDAGPNLILLFLDNQSQEIKKHFPAVEIIAPFAD